MVRRLVQLVELASCPMNNSFRVIGVLRLRNELELISAEGRVIYFRLPLSVNATKYRVGMKLILNKGVS